MLLLFGVNGDLQTTMLVSMFDGSYCKRYVWVGEEDESWSGKFDVIFFTTL